MAGLCSRSCRGYALTLILGLIALAQNSFAAANEDTMRPTSVSTASDEECGPVGCPSDCSDSLMAWLEDRDTLFGSDNLIDQTFEGVLGWKNDLPVPIKVGA